MFNLLPASVLRLRRQRYLCVLPARYEAMVGLATASHLHVLRRQVTSQSTTGISFSRTVGLISDRSACFAVSFTPFTNT